MIVGMAVQVNGSLANHTFNSWRIEEKHDVQHESKALPAPVLYQTSYGADFIRTYTAVLHNNLTHLPSGVILVFLTDKDCIKLYQLAPFHDLGITVALPENPIPPELQEPPSVVEVVASQGGGNRAFLYSCGSGHFQIAEAAGDESVFQISQPCPVFQEDNAAVPFVIIAAARCQGEIRALIWRTVDRREGLPAHVAVYAIDFAILSTAAETQLEIKRRKLLKRAALGPQVAHVDPDTGNAVVGLDPGEGLDGLAWGDPSEGNGNPDTTAPAVEPQPRSLAAAAEQMRDLQSELAERPAPDPHVDMFGEEDDGETSGAANLDILQYSEQAEGGLDSTPSARIQCRPYKLLATATDGILGLTADVDCALFQMQPGEEGGKTPLRLHHAASIPALAYVVEGKTQRKFVLLGKLGSRVAAVIVESHKYAFVYYTLQHKTDTTGKLQVIELGLQHGGPGVLGAALVEDGEDVMLCVLSADSFLTWKLR